MRRELTENELRYTKVIHAIGLAMCAHVILFAYLMPFLWSVFSFSGLSWLYILSETAGYVAEELLYALFYLLSFLLPILVLKCFLGRENVQPKEMYTEPRLSRYLPYMIFAIVFLVRIASDINYGLLSLFSVGGGSIDVATPPMSGVELVLEFIVTCVVPGFCEELLFRGAILTNCLPFGRTNAIVISSLLFAMMHENPTQILYTFVAGVLLGLVYEKTGSIWNCIVLHIMNNLFSTLDSFFVSNFRVDMAWIGILWDAIVMLLGVISIAVLIARFHSSSRDFENGFYQSELPASDSYADLPITGKRAVRLFFMPAMIVYIVLFALSFVLWW